MFYSKTGLSRRNDWCSTRFCAWTFQFYNLRSGIAEGLTYLNLLTIRRYAMKYLQPPKKTQLQSDLHRLENWSSQWQMNFNLSTCNVLHIGSNNNRSNYSVNGSDLLEVNEEKGLGVIIRNDLNPANTTKEL